MTLRPILLVFALAALPTPAQPPRPAPPTSLSGTLRGAAYTHDGKSEWAAILATSDSSYLVTGGGKDYASLKKLVGKRVTLRGTLLTETPPGAGPKTSLAGKIAGHSYAGLLEIRSASDATVIDPTDLVGLIEKLPPPTPTSPAPFVLRLDPTTTYSLSPAATKKLAPFSGQRVRLRAYLSDHTIDEVLSAIPEKTNPPAG